MKDSSFDGVIFNYGPFTPSSDEIVRLERDMPAFLSQHQSAFDPTKAVIRERLPNYKRQYWGVIENCKRAIFVNALCDVPEGENGWRWRRIIILDGGDCFFNVKYDPDTGTFFALSVNGEA